MGRRVGHLHERPRSLTRRDAVLRLQQISGELDELTQRRWDLWRSTVRTPATAAEIREVSRRLEQLWDTYRWLQGVLRNGCHSDIRIRARREEELERAVRRRAAAHHRERVHA
jgi:hypothetical protein